MNFRILLAAAALALPACAPMTPDARIARAPSLYDSLTPKQQDLVRSGRIANGMSRDAVYLAWGSPDNVTRGSESGKSFEKWRYAALRPVYRTHIGIGFGHGYYRHRGHHRHYHGPDFFYETGPDYVPVTVGIVRFVDGRVSAWETTRQ